MSGKNVYLPPVRIAENTRDKLRVIAEHRQSSVSALVREAIILLIEREAKNGNS